MTITPQSNKIEIVRNTTNIDNIKNDIKDIKLEVTNHLPTQIKALEVKIDKKDKEQDAKINQVMIKMAGITSTLLIISQIVFLFINK